MSSPCWQFPLSGFGQISQQFYYIIFSHLHKQISRLTFRTLYSFFTYLDAQNISSPALYMCRSNITDHHQNRHLHHRLYVQHSDISPLPACPALCKCRSDQSRSRRETVDGWPCSIKNIIFSIIPFAHIIFLVALKSKTRAPAMLKSHHCSFCIFSGHPRGG